VLLVEASTCYEEFHAAVTALHVAQRRVWSRRCGARTRRELRGRAYRPVPDKQLEDFTRWDTVSMDLNMLAIHGAGGWRVRTRDEFEKIIEAGELVLSQVVGTRSAVNVIECAAA
jgi:hypothetical protein